MNYFEDIVRAVDFIEAQLREELSVADVAAVNGLSSWHFQRIFHDEVGETIGSYVRRRRLASAWDELQLSDRKVIDVALDWRFGSSEAFSRAFKAEFGFSPQQKRKAGVKAAPYRRPKLDRPRLRYLADHGKLVPEIREVAAFTVVGLPVTVPSPFSRPHEYLGQIPGVWREFVSRMGEGGAYKYELQALCISRTCKASWTRETVDLVLLAKLRWKDGLKLEEIAVLMGIGMTTVKRGLRKLRLPGAMII